MVTPDNLEFEVPQRRKNWRTQATSNGLEGLFILMLLSVGFLFPDSVPPGGRQTVTELTRRRTFGVPSINLAIVFNTCG
jgi:hypothetical protein